MEHHDDFIHLDPDDFGLRELRDIISGAERRPRIPAIMALSVLRRKLGAAALDELESIALDTRAAPRVRRAAIDAMVEVDRADVPRRIEPLVRDGQPAVARAALTGLGRRGDAATLDLLRYRTLPAQLKDAQGLTTALIAARTGQRAKGVPSGHVPHRIALGRKKAEDVAVSRPRPPRRGQVLADLASLDLPLLDAGMLEFRCAGQRLMFVQADIPDVHRLPSESTVAGVVAAFEDVESSSWMPALFVLVEGRKDDGPVQVHLRSAGGSVRYSGEFDPRTGRFSLGAEDRPGAVPVDVRGRYEEGAVTIDKARSGVQSRGSLEPELLE